MSRVATGKLLAVDVAFEWESWTFGTSGTIGGEFSTTGFGGISAERIRFRTEEWTVSGTAEVLIFIAAPPSMYTVLTSAGMPASCTDVDVPFPLSIAWGIALGTIAWVEAK